MRIFNFDRLVAGYYSSITEKYPRLTAWEFVWDWVQQDVPWTRLASKEMRQRTALHLGFYLANWGMLRGSSDLLRVNLDFFEDLVVHLFDGRRVPSAFWDLQFTDFAPEAKKREQACDLFDKAKAALVSFESTDIWTNTLVTKILLGLWGQIPAFDVNVNAGLRTYLREHPEYTVKNKTWVSSATLTGLASIAADNRWQLRTPRKTRHGHHRYPAGKIIDMAFFQYGWNLLRPKD
jgi:hypothetical protein